MHHMSIARTTGGSENKKREANDKKGTTCLESVVTCDGYRYKYVYRRSKVRERRESGVCAVIS